MHDRIKGGGGSLTVQVSQEFDSQVKVVVISGVQEIPGLGEILNALVH